MNLLQQLKSRLKCTINLNKYESKVSLLAQNQYFGYLIDWSFLWVDRIYVLPFKDNTVGARDTRYFLLKVEIKDYNEMTFLVNLSATT